MAMLNSAYGQVWESQGEERVLPFYCDSKARVLRRADMMSEPDPTSV